MRKKVIIKKEGTIIIDGRKLKSINHYYNKQKAKKQSILDKQNLKTSKAMVKLHTKRNNKANDYIKKSARLIVNHCIANNIGTIIVGYNSDFKRNINLGKATNQQFTQISFGALREAIKNLCDRYNINYIEQEESYTSKASFLDNDEIPCFNPNNEENKHSFSGKRIKRGLYKSSKGLIINADVNGACNILSKSKQNFNHEELCIGLLVSPNRIRVN